MTQTLKAILAATLLFACQFSLLPVEAVLADEYLPMISAATGREFGRYYRADGSAPTRVQGEADKLSCIMDEGEVSKSVADRISVLAKTSREAAEVELAKAIRSCMSAKGWQIVIVSAPMISSSKIVAVDVALDQMASTLPRQVDEHSDLVRVRRIRTDVIYTIQIRAKSQSIADEMRKASLADPRAAEVLGKSLMKQTACKPEPNRFLIDGFAMIWEMLDIKGLVSRTRLTLPDCK